MDEERRVSIGATVRTLREAQGQSRQDLARTAKISVEMLAKLEQGRKAPSAATLAALASGLGLEAPDLAHRANAWQAFAALGTSLAGLRAGTIAGTLAVGVGASVMPIAAGTVGAYAAVKHEARKRLLLEQLLQTSLEQLSEADLQDVDLHDIAARLGVEMPVEDVLPPGGDVDRDTSEIAT